MVVLSLALMSAARLTVEAAQIVERAVRGTEALALASSVSEVLQAAPADAPWVAPGGALDRPVSSSDGKWFLDAGRFQVRWRVESAGPSLRRIHLAVVDRSASRAAASMVIESVLLRSSR